MYVSKVFRTRRRSGDSAAWGLARGALLRECLLFPKADVPILEKAKNRRSAFGRGCVKTHRISRTMGQHPTLVTKASQMRFRFPISISSNCESRCNLPPTLFIFRFHTASADSGRQNQHFSAEFNDRFGEKRTFRSWSLRNQSGTAALPPEADIGLILTERAANDPKRTFFGVGSSSQCFLLFLIIFGISQSIARALSRRR